MAMKAMKVAKKSTTMKAAKAAKVAAPPKRTAMKKQATKSKHTTWNFGRDEWIALARVRKIASHHITSHHTMLHP